MAKIPVGATIAQAYRFAFGDFLKILGTVWAPWAVTALVGFFLLPRLANIFIALGKHDFAATSRLSGPLLLFLPIAIFLYFIQIAATVALSLQPSPRQTWFCFPVGKPVWRLIGAYLLMLLIYIGVWIATILLAIPIGVVAALVAAAVKSSTQAVVMVSIYGVTALMYGAFIYITVRLAFLIAPVVIAEEKISLRRPGSLVRGNFWRLLVVFLATVLPFWLIQRVVMAMLTPTDLVLTAPPGASAEVKAAILAHTMNWAAQLLDTFRDYWYITYPVALVWWIAQVGAIFGAQSFAYRALVPEAASANPL